MYVYVYCICACVCMCVFVVDTCNYHKCTEFIICDDDADDVCYFWYFIFVFVITVCVYSIQ